MGFSQADWEELQKLQGRFDKIRFGPRSYRPPSIQLTFLPQTEKPKRPAPKDRRKPPPGYERFQLRLW